MSYYRSQLETFLSELNVQATRVLDIGGQQKPIKGRTKTWKVKDYQILDLPEYNLEIANTLNNQPEADIIFCLEVFEYLINPLSAFGNIAALLKENGRAYISFPLIYPLHNEVELDSLRYTETGVRRLVESVGLKVHAIHYRRTRPYADEGTELINNHHSELVNYYAYDGMKMAKGFDHEITGYIVEAIK